MTFRFAKDIGNEQFGECILMVEGGCSMVFIATFKNISVISILMV